MPQLSVIVPVYNVEPFIHRCVNSILSQSYKDFELILVDDGSPDNCGIICDEYALKDQRVRVIHQENGGLSAARNSGLQAAAGEYVYFIDSDDYIESGLFESAVEELKEYDLVTINYRKVNEKGEEISQCCFSEPPLFLDDGDQRFAFLSSTFFDYKIGFEAWAHFYRKRIIDENNLMFEDNRRIFAEDLCFTFCYLLYAHSAFCMPGIYYDYFQRSDSIMGVQNRRYNFGRMNDLSKALKQHIYSSENSSVFKDHFPIIHMQVINNVLDRAKKNNHELSYPVIRKHMLEEIHDWAFFRNECLSVKKCLKKLSGLKGNLLSKKMYLEYKYYAEGSRITLCWLKCFDLLINLNRRRQQFQESFLHSN